MLQIILTAPVKATLNQVKLGLPWLGPRIWPAIFLNPHPRLIRNISHFSVSDLWSPPLCSSYFSCFQVVVGSSLDTSFHSWNIFPDLKFSHKHDADDNFVYNTHTHIFVKVFFCRSRNITFTFSIHRLISDFQGLSRQHSNDKYTGFPYSWSSCHNQGTSKVMSVMTGNMELPRWSAHHHR